MRGVGVVAAWSDAVEMDWRNVRNVKQCQQLGGSRFLTTDQKHHVMCWCWSCDIKTGWWWWQRGGSLACGNSLVHINSYSVSSPVTTAMGHHSRVYRYPTQPVIQAISASYNQQCSLAGNVTASLASTGHTSKTPRYIHLWAQRPKKEDEKINLDSSTGHGIRLSLEVYTPFSALTLLDCKQ